ncbi:MAG TPA: AMP-binding protein, partial [Usitatibacter sp.]
MGERIVIPSEGAGLSGSPGAALLGIVAELVRQSQPAGAIATPTLDSSLEPDLGIDSLARVELLLRLERAFDVRLPQNLLAAAETPRDLLRAVLAGTRRGSEALAATPIAQPGGGVAQAPDTCTTLVEALDWHVQRHPDRVHLVILDEGEEDERVTYAQLREEAQAVAAGLARRGIGASQAVAIMLPTGRDFFRAFTGILLAGAVPVPIYPPTRWAQMEEHLRRQARILDNCRATLLITVPEGKRAARLMQALVPTLAQVATAEDLAQPGATPALSVPGPSDPALLQYTSGSTGDPKGVVLTHANLLANIRAMGRAVGASADDVFVSWLPLYHDMGLIGAWMGGLYFGFPLVVMPPPAFLARPSRWLRAVHRYRGTLSSAPNFAYEICATRLDERDLEGLDLSS